MNHGVICLRYLRNHKKPGGDKNRLEQSPHDGGAGRTDSSVRALHSLVHTMGKKDCGR